MQNNQPIQYTATIQNVSEVTLYGQAAASYWQARLEGCSFQPASTDGRVDILLSATSARYMGSPFMELSISLAIQGSAAPSNFFLVQAFNSSAAFAWIERTFFQTPYYPAGLRVQGRLPAEIQASQGGRTILSAAMAGGEARLPTASQDEDWLIPIFLPAGKARKPQVERYFYGKLSGMTHVYPFVPGKDTFDLQPQAGTSLHDLKESGFTPKEWRIRPNAVHAKSKTYSR